jgi:hypothetical protein
MNAKFLLRKYLNTGVGIPEYQFNKLNTNLRTTYIRKRSIAIESGDDVRPFEIPYISQDTWIESVKKTPWHISFIENQTPELQMYVVKKNSFLIRDIKNPTPQVQMYAVEKDPSYIEYIENPTPQVQMVAIKDEPYNIRYIKNPTPQVQMSVVEKDPYNISYVKNPTSKVQMYAVEKRPWYIELIKNPTDEVQDYVLKNYKEYIFQIKNPNEKVKQYLLNNNINENTKKMKIILKESQIKNIISDIINKNDMSENYMFFSNLKQIKRQCELLLELNTEEVDNIIKNGHDWADDHISEAKNNMDQVFDFFMNETSNHEINEGKNKPTNPKLWQASLAWAKTKYDVCPSAYCNGAAAKRYKSKGGGWKKSITEIKNNNFETYHKTYTSAINDALDYAEKKGYTYDNDEVFTKIAMGPKKPKEGDTNRFSISLKKDDKEQKKSLNIQVYGMKETYELNCYIN